MRRIVLHIGTEKTGTTAIQDYLVANRAQLMTQGFYYPAALGRRVDMPAHDHVGLCVLVQSARTDFPSPGQLCAVSEANRESFAAAAERAFAFEMAHLPAAVHTVVLSCEFLHSSLAHTEEFERLRAFLLRFSPHVDVIAYLRRQDLLAQSHFSTRIKGGETWPSELFPARSSPSYPYFDYLSLLERYAGLFGEKHIHLRRFSRQTLRGGDIVCDFLHLLGLPEAMAPRRESQSNASLSFDALQVLSVLNPYVPPFVAGKWNQLRNGLVEELESKFSGRPVLAARSDAEAFYKQFRADNETLRARFAPEVAAPFFSEDFDFYPERAPGAPPSLSEVAPILARLWNYQGEEIRYRDMQIAVLVGELMKRDGTAAHVLERHYLDAIETFGEWDELRNALNGLRAQGS